MAMKKMLIDLNETLPKLNKQIKEAFELQDEFILKSDYLINYNIKAERYFRFNFGKRNIRFLHRKEYKETEVIKSWKIFG